MIKINSSTVIKISIYEWFLGENGYETYEYFISKKTVKCFLMQEKKEKPFLISSLNYELIIGTFSNIFKKYLNGKKNYYRSSK